MYLYISIYLYLCVLHLALFSVTFYSKFCLTISRK